ncbi:unnamed protein product [Paramecium sonneborni]|uniref:Uncharacterized protein n=1 Tax=Paramecium sonneborni TaxID=65129 RepID=A0A8S1RT61_9CILI|nr:unnamed protein product [Paramecium sonneborni]
MRRVKIYRNKQLITKISLESPIYILENLNGIIYVKDGIPQYSHQKQKVNKPPQQMSPSNSQQSSVQAFRNDELLIEIS